jgi:hypothetical protein
MQYLFSQKLLQGRSVLLFFAELLLFFLDGDLDFGTDFDPAVLLCSVKVTKEMYLVLVPRGIE